MTIIELEIKSSCSMPPSDTIAGITMICYPFISPIKNACYLKSSSLPTNVSFRYHALVRDVVLR